ncbi:hypothetical protein [Fischerella thermalis]|jgi:hypothetical protein|uniref:hypothetical protein n=1 Tax=Fischerella thermalis TaxID=372787 RepID=UPI000C801040|nr:hypothetical protein [Fischerella thermalis]PLZ04510.1 hypothetical protein CBP18_21850 [Fischerella thermalis WC119]PLZ13516.1 hypothetical protein CBP19_09670 [Fischerella thermalis WC1110]PLZ23166.1 hypothetical protein CBP29_12780 [Fischerella thermalis WC341]PLZ30311.1 hypothetical protein CBP28_08360 [Fischerella thermalis WC559]PLZ33750.1 hypothetical protein CBP10_07230 [Fischerella thermalis WC558]
MSFLQFRLYHKGSLKLAFVSLSCLLFFSPLAKTQAEIKKESTLVSNLNHSLIQLTQKQVCPSAQLLPKRIFETDKYYVYICRGDEKSSLGYYVQIYKNSGSKIIIPISNKVGEAYFAKDTGVIYTVTPYELVVTKFSKRNSLVLREKVNNAIAADGQSLTKGCPEGNTSFVEAATKNYIVYICGREMPDTYIALTKNGTSIITLPLLSNYNSSAKAEDSEYIAIKGKTRYLLNRKMLRVSRDGRNLVKEKVLYWH